MSSPSSAPRLLPRAVLLRRGPDELQVGYDGGTTLLVRDPDGAVQSVLSRCDGSATWPVLVEIAAAQGVGADRLGALLSMLADLHLVAVDDPARRAQAPARLRLVGAGRLGAAIGDLLLGSGVDQLYVVDGGPPDPARYPITASGTAADAYRSASRGVSTQGRSPSREPVVVVNHWSKPEAVRVPVTVVAADTLEPDRAVPDGLLRFDAPHLLVRPAPDGAVVGPLVVPGRTSCVRCADLTRRDCDVGWPGLLGQLSRIRVPMSAAVTAWAAATAVHQVLGFLGGADVETLGATLEISGADHRLRWRSWSTHPECSCSW